MQLDLRPNVQPVKLWRSHMAVTATHVLAARCVSGCGTLRHADCVQRCPLSGCNSEDICSH
jgi:hypothetical protein